MKREHLDFILLTVFISERRGERAVAIVNLVWYLLGEVKMRKCSSKEGTAVLGGQSPPEFGRHIL